MTTQRPQKQRNIGRNECSWSALRRRNGFTSKSPSATRQRTISLISCCAIRRGGDLPAFSAGAHIEIELPNGMRRCYSLCNAPGRDAAYEIAILCEPNGRGGSKSAHADLVVGSRLRIHPPRNHFPLGDEPHAVLVGGGVGVTPILAMAEELSAEGRSFEFHYCARSPSRAAFIDRLTGASFAPKARLHFDDGAPSQNFDAGEVIRSAPEGAGLYVCGPNGFMEFVLSKARLAGWSERSPALRIFRRRRGAGRGRETICDRFWREAGSASWCLRRRRLRKPCRRPASHFH